MNSLNGTSNHARMHKRTQKTSFQKNRGTFRFHYNFLYFDRMIQRKVNFIAVFGRSCNAAEKKNNVTSPENDNRQNVQGNRKVLVFSLYHFH